MTLSKNNYSNEQPNSTHQQSSENSDVNIVDNYNNEELVSPQKEVVNINLLEEKLRVNRSKQKIGEVIIRKEIETRMIQVPIQREKLIVERVGKNPEKLAEVVIKEETVNGFNHEELKNADNLHITKSHYLELQTARQLLESIAHLDSANNPKICLEIVTTSSEHQIEHQNICDRFTPNIQQDRVIN